MTTVFPEMYLGVQTNEGTEVVLNKAGAKDRSSFKLEPTETPTHP